MASATTPQAPQAAKKPAERTHHDDVVVDDYDWLREKESPAVLEHLRAENAYTETITSGQEPLRDAIFGEIKHRTVETDLTVPSRRGSHWYFPRTIEGEQHPVHCRVPASGPSRDDSGSLAAWTPPEILPGEPLQGETTFFDTNAEASSYAFYQLGGMAIDEAGALLAYSEDTTGDELYTLRFRDLGTGENYPEQVTGVHGGPVLEPSGERAFYMVADASWRPYRLYVHTLGTSADEDTLLLEVDNQELWTGIELSADKRDLVIVSGNSEYDETRILDVDDPEAMPELLISADQRLLHAVDPIELDGERHLLVTHNQDGPNNAVSLTTAEALIAQLPAVLDGADAPAPLDLGRTILAHEETVKLEGVVVTAAQILVDARAATIASVRLLPLEMLRTVRDGGQGTTASELTGPEFPAELYSAHILSAEYEAPLFRVLYTSWFTPVTVYDVPHPRSSGSAGGSAPEPLLRRETPVHDVDLSAYRAHRLWADSGDTDDDGLPVQIPITVLAHRDIRPDSTNPAVIYGYGSYEISMDPALSLATLSLLDRGIVFAIAHVRGGGELGRRWYERGKKLHKKNTFTDFIAATEHLASQGWADPQRVAALGGSAGGLLMGAIANMAPEKYAAIVAQVPFVDTLTSILDPDLPLSALEWEEWGNPITDPEVYRYMKSYSPYENVRDQRYPAIAAVTSLHDTRVLYVEPAKWVQVLREHQQGDAPIVLKIEMDGGHGGASGRYETWRERAWDYAFLAHHLGVPA